VGPGQLNFTSHLTTILRTMQAEGAAGAAASRGGGAARGRAARSGGRRPTRAGGDAARAAEAAAELRVALGRQRGAESASEGAASCKLLSKVVRQDKRAKLLFHWAPYRKLLCWHPICSPWQLLTGGEQRTLTQQRSLSLQGQQTKERFPRDAAVILQVACSSVTGGSGAAEAEAFASLGDARDACISLAGRAARAAADRYESSVRLQALTIEVSCLRSASDRNTLSAP